MVLTGQRRGGAGKRNTKRVIPRESNKETIDALELCTLGCRTYIV